MEEKMVIGNTHGLALLNKMEDMVADIKQQKSITARHELLIQQQQREIDNLKAANITYTKMKRHCLAVYKRNYYPAKMTAEDRKDIRGRNMEAHTADPQAEAGLYVGTGRNDIWLYKDLYLLTPHEVDMISKSCDGIAYGY